MQYIKTGRLYQLVDSIQTPAVNAIWWIYDKMITEPMRIFYFVGPWWGNAPKPEICYEITGIESKWWESTSTNMEECGKLVEKSFESWNAGVMTTLYFTALTFTVLQFFCTCCVVKPIIRAVRQQ
jgi:hypothetical protein